MLRANAGLRAHGRHDNPSARRRATGSSVGAKENRRRAAPNAARRCSDSGASAADQRVIDNKHDNRTNHGDQDAVEVDTRHAGHSEGLEQIPTGNRSNDAQYDIEYKPFAGLVDNFACNETGYQSEHDPRNE
jgi:hypothetical protein